MILQLVISKGVEHSILLVSEHQSVYFSNTNPVKFGRILHPPQQKCQGRQVVLCSDAFFPCAPPDHSSMSFENCKGHTWSHCPGQLQLEIILTDFKNWFFNDISFKFYLNFFKNILKYLNPCLCCNKFMF